MKPGPPGSFGAQLKALREAAGYSQEELATIAGLSVQGTSRTRYRRGRNVSGRLGTLSGGAAAGERVRDVVTFGLPPRTPLPSRRFAVGSMPCRSPSGDLEELAGPRCALAWAPTNWSRAHAAGRTMSIDALLKDIEGVARMG